MTFSHSSGSYNVEATLMAWLYEQLIAYKPPLVTTVFMAGEFPEKAVQCPVWSVHFTTAESDEGGGYQGGHVDTGKHGTMMYGIMEVGCWVSRANDNWRAQKAQMVDVVTYALNTLLGTGAAVIIHDWYTSSDAPPETSYKVSIRSWSLRPPPVDPNPDIERERVLVFYQWVERV